ncbi:MAG: phosphatidate cytidylyltransferase [Muribaculaceae bacterium]|nr:phosphatidate cytidylyltransferase [Muribaculaceae bacterium]
MNNMLLRAISGSVYVAVIVLCIIFGPRWFTLLTGVFGVIGINEVVKMFNGTESRGSVVAQYLDLLFFAVVLLLPYMTFVAGNDTAFMILIVLAALYIPVRMIAAVGQKGDNTLRQVAGAFFGLIYVGLPLLMVNTAYIISWALNRNIVISVMLVSFVLIWLNDTGAYLSGRTFGRHKLCERLSPKKTWEGFWGGFALCIVASVVYAFVSGLNPVTSGCYGAVVSVASTFGDLFESLIKRKCGVKDSGTLIPGHGGVLDRIDSFLAVAPLAVLMLLASETLL